MADSSKQRFVGPAADDIRLEPLGVLTACYHRVTARTHLLVEPAPEILLALTGKALSHVEVMAALAQQFDLDSAGDDMAAALDARLDELVETGLVTQIRGAGDV